MTYPHIDRETRSEMEKETTRRMQKLIHIDSVLNLCVGQLYNKKILRYRNWPIWVMRVFLPKKIEVAQEPNLAEQDLSNNILPCFLRHWLLFLVFGLQPVVFVQ